MSGALVPVPSAGRVELARSGAAIVLPEVIVDAGPVAVERFLEYFAAGIANARRSLRTRSCPRTRPRRCGARSTS